MSDTVTIYDIARVANVSASTVSRTFSRPDKVGPRTAAKVRAAAAELGYRVDLGTGMTSGRGTRLLGIIAPDLSNPFFQEIFRGAQEAAHVSGMGISLVETGGSVRQAMQKAQWLSELASGLLLASTRLSNGEIQHIARTIPSICLNRPVPGIPSVLVDNYDGAIKALHHLVDQGITSATYLSGPDSSWADAMRWRGLLDSTQGTRSPSLVEGETKSTTLMNVPLPITLRKIQLTEPTINGGRLAFAEWQKRPTDAVLCFNDIVAVGFLDQARRHDVEVPKDVAVVGFDYTEITAMFPPGLTTVAGPLHSLGYIAASNLIAITKGSTQVPTGPQVLPTKLVIRESSLFGQRPTSENLHS